MIETHHRTYKETGITLFWETPIHPLSALVSLRRVLQVGFSCFGFTLFTSYLRTEAQYSQSWSSCWHFQSLFHTGLSSFCLIPKHMQTLFHTTFSLQTFLLGDWSVWNSTVCLPQCVRDFLTVIVMFSLWICQTRRAVSSTPSFLQSEAAGTPRIHQADFSCLSALANVGKTHCSYLHALAFCSKH